jgi:hypothetical protein
MGFFFYMFFMRLKRSPLFLVYWEFSSLIDVDFVKYFFWSYDFSSLVCCYSILHQLNFEKIESDLQYTEKFPFCHGILFFYITVTFIFLLFCWWLCLNSLKILVFSYSFLVLYGLWLVLVSLWGSDDKMFSILLPPTGTWGSLHFFQFIFFLLLRLCKFYGPVSKFTDSLPSPLYYWYYPSKLFFLFIPSKL